MCFKVEQGFNIDAAFHEAHLNLIFDLQSQSYFLVLVVPDLLFILPENVAASKGL